MTDAITEITMPRLSDSMHEGTILTWLKADGEQVQAGDELLEIETDKATMAYESPAAGVLTIVAQAGDTLEVGAVIATLGGGVAEITGEDRDMGKFRAPTLRNIAVTAPYMHDGSIATLDGVLDHYAAGGRTIASGPHAGIGHDNPNKDPLIGGFELSGPDRQDLIAFLLSLTDEAVLHDPRFANPWLSMR